MRTMNKNRVGPISDGRLDQSPIEKDQKPKSRIETWGEHLILALIAALLLLVVGEGIKFVLQPPQKFSTLSTRGHKVPGVRVVIGAVPVGTTDLNGTLVVPKQSGECQLFDALTDEQYDIQVKIGDTVEWRRSVNIDADRAEVPLIVHRSSAPDTQVRMASP